MKWQTMTAERDEPGFETTYNLFRRKLAPDLYCAAPEHYIVPAFLDGDTWEYAGALRPGDSPPLGFDATAAELGARLNGFHLFQAASRIVLGIRRRPGYRPIMVPPPSGRQHAGIDQSHHLARPADVNIGFPQSGNEWRTRRMPEHEPRTVSTN